MMPATGERAVRPRAAVFTVLIAALGMLLTFGPSAPAFGHAELLDTTPKDGAVLETAPDTVDLRFNEPVQVVKDAIRLFPGDGTPVVLDARTIDATLIIDLPDDLGDGAYALAYRIVSADGHPVGGALNFQVGAGDYTTPDTSASPVEPIVTDAIVSALTATQYLGLLMLAGLLFFNHFIARAAHPAGPRIRRLSRIAYGIALTTSLLLIPVSGARVTGNEFFSYLPETGDLVLLPAETWMPGVSSQLLVTAALVLILGLAVVILDARSRTPLTRITGILCATGALATPLLIGHTQTVQRARVMLAADLGHLLAGAFWVGGIAALLCYLAAARPDAPGAAPRIPPGAAIDVVFRFSRYAFISVIALAFSGTSMAILVVGSWNTLFDSAYGRILLVKLGIVAAVILLAACNRLYLLPRIAGQSGEQRKWTALRRILTGEAALLIAVLAVTGFLTNTSPADTRANPSSGSTAVAELDVPLHTESQGLTVDGTLAPATTGTNTLILRLEYEGNAITIEDVTVEARLPEQQLGPFTATPILNTTTGDYEAVLTMPVAGEWRIQVSARIDVYAQPIAIMPVTIQQNRR